VAGLFCPKHQRWWPDGECRWCEGLREEREAISRKAAAAEKQMAATTEALKTMFDQPPRYPAIIDPRYPLVPGAVPMALPRTSPAVPAYPCPCSCQMFTCTAQSPGWFDLMDGAHHTPAKCGKP
jgi:hypothetical protein